MALVAKIPAVASKDAEIALQAVRLYYNAGGEGGCFQIEAEKLPPAVKDWVEERIKARLERTE